MSLRRINKFLITGVVSLFSFLASCKSEQPISPTQGGSSDKRAYTTKNVPAPLFKENNQYLQLNGKDSYLSFDKYFEYDRIVIIYKSRQKEIYPLLSDGDTFSLYSIDSLDKICPTKPSLPTGHDFSDKSFDFLSFNGESLLGIKKANYGVNTYTDIMFPEEGKRLTTFVSADYGMFISTPNHQWNHVFSRETTLEKPFVRSKNPLKIGIGKPFCGSPSVNGNSFFDGEIESIVFYYKYQKVREYHFLKENVVNGKLTDRITNQQDLTLHGTFEYTNFPTQDTAKLTDPNYYFDTKLQDTEALGDTVVTLFSNNGNNLYAKIRNSKTKQVLKDEFLVTSNAKNGKMEFFSGNILFSYQDTSNNNLYFKEFSSTGILIKDATKVNSTQLPPNVLFDINVDPSQNYFGFAYDNLDNSNWSNKFVYYTPSSVFSRIFDRAGKAYNELQMSTHFDYRNQRFYAPAIALYGNEPRASVFCTTQYNDTTSAINPLVSFDLDFNANTVSRYTGGFGMNNLFSPKVFTHGNGFMPFFNGYFSSIYQDYSSERGFSVNAITRSFYNDYILAYVSNKDTKSKYQMKKGDGTYPQITGREHVLSTSVAYVSDGFIASEQVGELLSTWKYNTTTGTWTLIDVVKLTDALKMKATQIITGPSIEISGNNFPQYSGISYFVSGTQGGKALITVVTPSGRTLTKQVSLGINGNYSGILPTSFTSEVGNYTIWSIGENPTTERGNVTQFTISNLYAITNTITNKPFLRGEVHTVTNLTVGTAELEPKTQIRNDSALVWSEPKNATIPTLATAELNSLRSSAPVLAENKLSQERIFVDGCTRFNDVIQGKWYFDYINNARMESWLEGFSGCNFEPESTITRADFAKILVMAMENKGIKLNYGASFTFSDVSFNSQYKNAIYGLLNYGVIDSTDKFRPFDNLTKVEAIKMVVKAFDKGFNINEKCIQVPLDKEKQGQWYSSYLGAAISRGVLDISNGSSDSNISVNILRAEAVKIIYTSKENNRGFNGCFSEMKFEFIDDGELDYLDFIKASDLEDEGLGTIIINGVYVFAGGEEVETILSHDLDKTLTDKFIAVALITPIGKAGKVEKGTVVATKIVNGVKKVFIKRIWGTIFRTIPINIEKAWYKGTFKGIQQSIEHHFLKHGKGRTLEKYTEDALKHFDVYKSQATKIKLKTGADGLKLPGGKYTLDGQIVTYWW